MILLRCCVLYNSNNGLLGDALGDHDVQPGLQLSEATPPPAPPCSFLIVLTVFRVGRFVPALWSGILL